MILGIKFDFVKYKAIFNKSPLDLYFTKIPTQIPFNKMWVQTNVSQISTGCPFFINMPKVLSTGNVGLFLNSGLVWFGSKPDFKKFISPTDRSDVGREISCCLPVVSCWW
jgi:hypothetical protein